MLVAFSARRVTGLALALTLVLLAAPLAFPQTAEAAGEFQVVAGAVDNAVRLAFGAEQAVAPFVEVIDRPGWLENIRVETAEWDDREALIRFDVAPHTPLDTRGTLVAQVHMDHGSVTRRWPLRVSEAAPRLQFGHRLTECCLAASGIDVDPGGRPLQHQLLGGAPNPWRDLTHIRFGLAGSGGSVTLRILDAGGRCVYATRTHHLAAGFHQIAWTGIDDAGRPVPPGVYLYELLTEDWRAAGKTLLVR